MTLTSVTSRIVRIVSGTVTRVARCHALAPSTRAASVISDGIAWIAATNRIMPNPRTVQTIEMITAQVDTLGSTPSDRIGSSMMPSSRVPG
jgi:hypothetical protein